MSETHIPNEGYPYLSNTKADVRLLGSVPILNPFMDKLSSQRGMMMSDHLSQALVVNGCEMPRCYTGFESKIGKYSINESARDHDAQILAVIPRFVQNEGLYPVHYNPMRLVVYRDMVTRKIECFPVKDYTTVTDDFGYRNVYGNTALNVGSIVSSEDDIVHAPTVDGNIYKLFGCNLNVAYMAIPQVSEDGVAISESTAKKMETEGYSTLSIDIGPNQIPLNLYGDDVTYKFMPDIGDTVNKNGIVCALRTPTNDSFIYDTMPKNLTKVQHLHDKLFYIPAGAEIIDIYVCINRKNKPIATTKDDRIYQQAEIYRQKLNDYYRAVYDTYRANVKDDSEIGNTFNTVVASAIAELQIAGEYLNGSGITRKAGLLLPMKNKAAIDFIHIDIKYRYRRPVRHGFKLTGRFGNKGVISTIIPDNECPVDEEGFRADIIIDPASVFNRMNPGQQYEQFINRGNELIKRRVTEVINSTNNYQQAFDMMVEWARDVNPNYADLIVETHQTMNDKVDLVNDLIRYGYFMQISPFQKGIDQKLVLHLRDKYGIKASPVTYTITDQYMNKRVVTTKNPVLIGGMYTLLLNKIPHQRVCGIGYVNTFRAAVKSGNKFNTNTPYAITAIRLGEDEVRNMLATSGGETVAKLLGMYGNNKEALDNLAYKLLNSDHPSRIEDIDMSLSEIIKGNNMVNVTKHMFSCLGVCVCSDGEE